MGSRLLVRILSLAALAAVYFAAGKLGLQLAILHPSASPVWPPTGIAIAVVVVLGAWTWPAIAVGAFAVNLTTSGHVVSSLGIAAGNTLEALVGGMLVARYANGVRAFDRALDVLRFALFAGLCGTVLSGTVGVVSLCLEKPELWPEFGRLWTTWWLGDFGGAIVVAPALILWSRPARVAWTRVRVAEGLVLLACVFLVGEVVFLGNLFPTLNVHPLAFLGIPPLLWAALRFGPRGTATAGLVLAAMATWATLNRRGSYGTLPPNVALLLLQAYLVVTMVTALTLAAVVREREIASELLRAKADELERSNAELEQFASAASHDLQEPLRNLLIYLQLVEREVHDRIGGAAEENLRVAENSARRMLEMIRGLLAFARAGFARSRVETVDTAVVVRELLEHLRPSVEECSADVRVGALPSLPADPGQLRLVFQNLIGNALKFRGVDPPRVEIGAQRRNGEWHFFVRDNGIGIAPTHQDRVFEVFQRLNPREKFPGSGIGLATCKRIVQRSGGRTWVESEPGKGSTFYFSLPSSAA